MLSLGFLNTNYGTSTLFNFVSKGIPFLFVINSPNVPAKDIPVSIHF